MNFATLFKAVDAVMTFRDVARRFKSRETPAEAPSLDMLQSQPAAPGLGGQIEARLTNVVVAALKEAFDRDHARLELERTQLEEQRRRAEAAVQLELRRQAADRELARLRLLAGTAMLGWIASVAIVAAGLAGESLPARIVLGAGWLLLLAAFGTAFTAQGRIGTALPTESREGGDIVAAATLWLLLAGLAATAVSLLL